MSMRVVLPLAGLVLMGAMFAPRSAMADCPFEILRGCRCPSGCDSDSCERTCVVVGQTPSGGCTYSCQPCACGGIGCVPRRRGRADLVLGWLSGEASAAELRTDSAPADDKKIIETQNADGDFVIVPQSEVQRLKDEAAGIGVFVARAASGEAQIRGLADRGPAKKAGLKAGDIIVSVDGRKTSGVPQTRVSRWLRGRPGTFVVLQVMGQDGKTRKVTVYRSDLSTFETQQKPGVTLKRTAPSAMKSDQCPDKSDGCNFLTKEGDECIYTCRENLKK